MLGVSCSLLWAGTGSQNTMQDIKSNSQRLILLGIHLGSILISSPFISRF